MPDVPINATPTPPPPSPLEPHTPPERRVIDWNAPTPQDAPNPPPVA